VGAELPRLTAAFSSNADQSLWCRHPSSRASPIRTFTGLAHKTEKECPTFN
jgi:hypothetical protein